jgi:hypothetical protein
MLKQGDDALKTKEDDKSASNAGFGAKEALITRLIMLTTVAFPATKSRNAI